MLNGRDILKTLIELLEAQEEIKVQYEIGGNNGTLQPPDGGTESHS